jgi:hypothetical protein
MNSSGGRGFSPRPIWKSAEVRSERSLQTALLYLLKQHQVVPDALLESLLNIGGLVISAFKLNPFGEVELKCTLFNLLLG